HRRCAARCHTRNAMRRGAVDSFACSARPQATAGYARAAPRWVTRRMTAPRRLAAILAADVAGYSRLMEADEEGTLERLKALRRELVDPKIAQHHGRIVKSTGDGLLVEFPSVVDAVRCAVAAQQAKPHELNCCFPISSNE